MSARVLLEVALRILGLWYLFNSIVTIATAASWYLAGVGAPADVGTSYLVSTGTSAATQLVIGVALIRWAPNMAARLDPSDVHKTASQIRVGPGDIYHTACFVLGTYLLVHGVEFWGWLATRALSSSTRLAGTAVSAIVYSASGLLLIFGSRQIGQFMSNLRYDPDSIPQQQYSLKLLLIITVLVAAILGVIRLISVRGL